jgi:hypothetical protein
MLDVKRPVKGGKPAPAPAEIEIELNDMLGEGEEGEMEGGAEEPNPEGYPMATQEMVDALTAMGYSVTPPAAEEEPMA